MPLAIRRSWQYIQTVLGIIFRHPVTGATIIPLLANGEIVLVRRRDTGEWGFPGGIIDWGEDLPTAIKRELQEETGLELVQIDRLVGVYSSPDRDPRLHSICIAIVAQVQGHMNPRDTLEISEVKSFRREDLPLGTLCHDHDQQLQDYLEGKTTIA